MIRIVLFLLFFALTQIYGQVDSSPIISDTSSIRQAAPERKPVRLFNSLLKETLAGTGGGILGGIIGVGVYSAFSRGQGDFGAFLGSLFVGYGAYTTGIAVGTNLSIKSDGYNPPMLGTITVSFLSGVAGWYLYLSQQNNGGGIWKAYPLYFPLISSMLYNRLINHKPASKGTTFDLYPGISRHGASLQMQMSF